MLKPVAPQGQLGELPNVIGNETEPPLAGTLWLVANWQAICNSDGDGAFQVAHREG